MSANAMFRAALASALTGLAACGSPGSDAPAARSTDTTPAAAPAAVAPPAGTDSAAAPAAAGTTSAGTDSAAAATGGTAAGTDSAVRTGATMGATPRVRGETLALPSGRQVVVLGAGPVKFTQGPPALMVRYATSISVDDTVPLAREAGEVFQAYRVRAERAKLDGLVASAFEMPKGGSDQQARGYNFSWSRGADGAWHRN